MVVATDVFRQLSILLLIAVASHFVIKRLRQPTIIGEIGIGIIIGPTIVGFLLNRDNPSCFPIPAAGCPAIFDESLIAIFAALGSIFLLFLIGLESDFREIKKSFPGKILIASLMESYVKERWQELTRRCAAAGVDG
ncbi:MAG: cation:proton antiporter, partial [Candidatus Thermoplasmatota archaeon]